jgi:uncharacterized SAM-binding protein YcdF (DUF218 family)
MGHDGIRDPQGGGDAVKAPFFRDEQGWTGAPTNRSAPAFMAVVDTMPLLRADAIVVLSGDGEGRLDFALGLMAGGGADKLVLSGGRDRKPFSLTAHDLARAAIDRGMDPSRLVLEAASQNTREQAVNVVAMAVEREWAQLLLVASPFHSYRAFLTFVQALRDAGMHEKIRVINAPASQLPWFKVPEGEHGDRLALLAGELNKIDTYHDVGHVASYADGLEYLRYWEGR